MDYKNRPFVMMKDYYRELDRKAKEEAEEHRKKRDKSNDSSSPPATDSE